MNNVTTESVESHRNVDLVRSFSFFFEDPHWGSKLFIGSLFGLLIPIVVGHVLIVGYGVIVARRRMKRETPYLPEWNDFQNIINDGLRGFSLTLVHAIPIWVVSVLLFLTIFGGLLLEVGSEVSFGSLYYFGIPTILGGLSLLLILLVGFICYVPAAFVRLIQTDRFGAAFDILAIVQFILEHRKDYVVALLTIVLAMVIGFLGSFVFFVGVFPTFFWGICVVGFVVGELAGLGRPSSTLSQ